MLSTDNKLEEKRAQQRERSKEWRAANREYHREQSRLWRAANQDITRKTSARWRAANSERARKNNRRSVLKRNYGLTQEQWDRLFRQQNERCAICKTDSPGSKRGWHTDHCHSTGVVRGILCHGCNTSLGHMKDSPQRLRAAADYLQAGRSYRRSGS